MLIEYCFENLLAFSHARHFGNVWTAEKRILIPCRHMRHRSVWPWAQLGERWRIGVCIRRLALGSTLRPCLGRFVSSTLWVKKYTWLLIIISANVDRFTKFLHHQFSEEILYTYTIRILHLILYNYVSTLPCKTWKLQCLPISMAYCIWYLRIHLARHEATFVAQVWIL